MGNQGSASIRLGREGQIIDAGHPMRMLLLLLVLALGAPVLLRADDPALDVTDVPSDASPSASGDPIKRFDGHMTLTTADFTVPDGWELRWRSDQLLTIGVIRRDNTVVAGTSGRSVGSLFIPQGGNYRLRVKGTQDVPWDVAVYAIKTAPPDDTSYLPTIGPVFKPIAETPTLVAPPPPPKPSPPVAAPLPRELTAEQKQSIVTIRGDRARGAGFFMKHGADTVLVTTQQLIANNPNWQAIAANGSTVQVTKILGASDRDVAMLSVKDFGYPALPEGDPMKLRPGDTLLTAGAGGLSLPPIYVDSLDQRRIVINELRPVEGSPLVLSSSGRVVGLIAIGPQALSGDDFNDETFNERDAEAFGSIAPYGERLDNVQAWEACDASQLQVEAQFLSDFHQRSRDLDAYLNGVGQDESRRLWKADDKIKSANDTFLQDTAGGDPEQRVSSLHSLLFELGVLSDTDMDQIQQPSNFYSYQRSLAQNEIAYRKALKGEIDQLSIDTTRFDAVVKANN